MELSTDDPLVGSQKEQEMKTSLNNDIQKAITVFGVIAMAFAVFFASPQSAAAGDKDFGADGNPVNCTNNWRVGDRVPIISDGGIVRGYSEMWWSESCQANWVRAWTVDGKETRLHSTVFQAGGPSPTREYAIADDHANDHFTLYLHAEPNEKMCGSSSILQDFGGRKSGVDYAFSGTYCKT